MYWPGQRPHAKAQLKMELLPSCWAEGISSSVASGAVRQRPPSFSYPLGLCNSSLLHQSMQSGRQSSLLKTGKPHSFVHSPLKSHLIIFSVFCQSAPSHQVQLTLKETVQGHTLGGRQIIVGQCRSQYVCLLMFWSCVCVCVHKSRENKVLHIGRCNSAKTGCCSWG